MFELCKDCQYINECKPKQEHREAVACCDFGLLDINGDLIDLDDSNDIAETKNG